VWTVSDARGKIPLHRNCKCSWSARNPDAGPNRRNPSPAPTHYAPGAGAKFQQNAGHESAVGGTGSNGCGTGAGGFRHGNTCARGGHPADHGLSQEAEAYLATAWFNGGGGRKRPEDLPAPRQAKLVRSYAAQVLAAERVGKPGVAQELVHAAPRVLPGAKLLSATGVVEPHDGGRHEFAPGPPLTGEQLRGTVRVLRPGLTFPAPKNRRLLGGGGGDAVVVRALVEPA